jgi:hypothetical protein
MSSMRSTFPIESGFDLDKIVEFNQAIIYSFEPENVLNYSQNELSLLLLNAAQYQETYDGYLYAQNNILPFIRKNTTAGLTSEIVLNWINELHKYMSNSVARVSDKLEFAGKYCSLQVTLWKPSVNMYDVFAKFVNSVTQPTNEQFGQLLDSELTASEIDQLDPLFDSGELQEFLQILIDLRMDNSVKISQDQLDQLKTPSDPFAQVVLKLCHKFQKGLYTKNEKQLICKFVKICDAPSLIPEKMQDMAKALVKKWSDCKTDDIEEIVRLAHFAFYQITDIHPYFNCNGRVATCMMNIILRSFNQPSIVLRLVEEKYDVASAYNQAIEDIDTRPELLIEYIKERVITNVIWSDDDAKKMAILRVQSATILKSIFIEYPNFKIEEYFTNLASSTNTIFNSLVAEIDKRNLHIVNPQDEIVLAVDKKLSQYNIQLKNEITSKDEMRRILEVTAVQYLHENCTETYKNIQKLRQSKTDDLC